MFEFKCDFELAARGSRLSSSFCSSFSITKLAGWPFCGSGSGFCLSVIGKIRSSVYTVEDQEIPVPLYELRLWWNNDLRINLSSKCLVKKL
jgi:hypothetical protein